MNVEILLEFIEELESEDIVCFMNIEFNKKQKTIVTSDITSEDEIFMKVVSENFDYIPIVKEPAHDMIPTLYRISFF